MCPDLLVITVITYEFGIISIKIIYRIFFSLKIYFTAYWQYSLEKMLGFYINKCLVKKMLIYLIIVAVIIRYNS